MSSYIEVSFMHAFRENNKGADMLANWGCSEKKHRIFSSWSQIPHKLREILRLHKIGLQNIRCKKLIVIYFFFNQ